MDSKRTEDVVELHAVISGDVQGIGFRAHTFHFATQLGLKGHVRNLDDGTVEIYAHGSKAQLQQLLEKVTSHFKLSSEKAVRTTFGKPTKTFDDFFIIH